MGQPRRATGQEGKVGRMTRIIMEKQKLLVGPSGAAVGKELRSAGVTEAKSREDLGLDASATWAPGNKQSLGKEQVPTTCFLTSGESNRVSE